MGTRADRGSHWVDPLTASMENDGKVLCCWLSLRYMKSSLLCNLTPDMKPCCSISIFGVSVEPKSKRQTPVKILVQQLVNAEEGRDTIWVKAAGWMLSYKIMWFYWQLIEIMCLQSESSVSAPCLHHPCDPEHRAISNHTEVSGLKDHITWLLTSTTNQWEEGRRKTNTSTRHISYYTRPETWPGSIAGDNSAAICHLLLALIYMEKKTLISEESRWIKNESESFCENWL